MVPGGTRSKQRLGLLGLDCIHSYTRTQSARFGQGKSWGLCCGSDYDSTGGLTREVVGLSPFSRPRPARGVGLILRIKIEVLTVHGVQQLARFGRFGDLDAI